MKRTKKRLKKHIKKALLNIITIIVSLIIYMLLAKFGGLATLNNVYANIIIIGWSYLFIGQFVVFSIINNN